MVEMLSPYKVKNITVPNRIVMPAMCQYVVENNDGIVNEWHKVHYGSRAIGKVGLIIVEATGVEPRGRITDYDLGIWSNRHIDGLKEIVDFAHKQGTVMGIQLAHAGRKATISDKENVIAPSSIPFDEKSVTPKEMTKEIIKEVVEAFAEGARRANEAGFDTIEIHAAHGYLIHEFLSPISNKRTDEYGGSRENRVRFLKEIIEETKKKWPNGKPILLRISASEYIENGIDVGEMIEILKLIKGTGIDIIDVSSGGILPVKFDIGPGYQVKFSEKIRAEVGIPTIAVGLVSEPELAEEILFNERADFVALGRELLRDPHWVLHAASKLHADLDWPRPYLQARK